MDESRRWGRGHDHHRRTHGANRPTGFIESDRRSNRGDEWLGQVGLVDDDQAVIADKCCID